MLAVLLGASSGRAEGQQSETVRYPGGISGYEASVTATASHCRARESYVLPPPPPPERNI